MKATWEAWLAAHPEFSLVGNDDGDDGEDFDVDDQDSESDGADDGEDDNSDDDDDVDGTTRRISRLEKDNARLSRELQAAIELLNEKADKEKSEGTETPEGFVPQEDYDTLLELLRTDYVESAISGFKNKDGSAKWEWEDTSAVYKFLDIDELEIDIKSKKIHGLEDQLADIAERYPFMLKGNKSSTDRKPGKTGVKPGKPGTREKKSDPSLEALIAEFPAMVD